MSYCGKEEGRKREERREKLTPQSALLRGTVDGATPGRQEGPGVASGSGLSRVEKMSAEQTPSEIKRKARNAIRYAG